MESETYSSWAESLMDMAVHFQGEGFLSTVKDMPCLKVVKSGSDSFVDGHWYSAHIYKYGTQFFNHFEGLTSLVEFLKGNKDIQSLVAESINIYDDVKTGHFERLTMLIHRNQDRSVTLVTEKFVIPFQYERGTPEFIDWMFKHNDILYDESDEGEPPY